MTAAPYTGRRIQDTELPPRSSDRQREEAPQSLPRRRNCGHSRAERQTAQKCAPSRPSALPSRPTAAAALPDAVRRTDLPAGCVHRPVEAATVQSLPRRAALPSLRPFPRRKADGTKARPLPAIGSAGAPDRRGRPAGRCSQDWPSRRMRSSPGRNSDGAILAASPGLRPFPRLKQTRRKSAPPPGHRLCRRARPPRPPCRTLFAGLIFPQAALIARTKRRRRNPCRVAGTATIPAPKGRRHKNAPLPAIGSAGAPDRRGRPAGRCSQNWSSRRMRSSPGRNGDGAILAAMPRVAKSAAIPAPEADLPQKRAPGHRLCRRARPPRPPCQTLFAGLIFPQDAFIARTKQRRRNPCRVAGAAAIPAPKGRLCEKARPPRRLYSRRFILHERTVSP